MRTARAVIIDENSTESLHLMQTLAREGIGAVYIAGDNPDFFPRPKLKGIRLVFLDLNLIGQLDANNYVPNAVQVLLSCIDMPPRSFGIVCWTTHEDEIELLQRELARQSVVPTFVLPIRGKAQLVARGSQAASDLLGQLDGLLGSYPGHKLLMGWEQFSHVATSDSTDRLVLMSPSDDEVVKVLAAVAKGAADDVPQTPDDSLLAMTAGMASIHQDAVEDMACKATIGAACECVHEVVVRLSSRPQSPEEREHFRRMSLSPESKSQLNSVLLTTTCEVLRPGNVYGCGAWFSDEDAQKTFKTSFIEETDSVRKSAHRETVIASSLIVAVEITPACDHAANKRNLARFLMGILTPLEGDLLSTEVMGLPATSRQFAKEFEPVALQLPGENRDRHVKLIVSARHLTTRAAEEFKGIRPLFRLRHRVVADIQAWFASHAARPGYVSVR